MGLPIETQAQRGQKPRQNGAFFAILVLDETADLGVINLRREEEEGEVRGRGKEKGRREEEARGRGKEEEEEKREGEARG